MGVMTAPAALPRTMQAVVLRGHGGLDQLDVREDVPVPVPAADEVLVQVGAAALNNTDINTRVGWYSKSVATATEQLAGDPLPQPRQPTDGNWSGQSFVFPRIQGLDACGRIVATGSGVSPARIGERVLVDPVVRTGEGPGSSVQYVGLERDGAFAQYLAVPAHNAHRIESPLSDVELACFPCAWGTAQNLVQRAGVGPDDTVLVTGASGGVGSAAVQLARLNGATVIAVTQSGKAGIVAGLGAARVVSRADDLLQTLGPESVDAVIDVVGGPAFDSLLGVLRRGGRYAVAGAIAGPVVPLDLRTLYLKDLTLYGCTVTTAGQFAALVRLIEGGRLRPVVGAVYPLHQLREAQDAFLSKAQAGKIVLVP
jgi:NADPH:quinone reductase-like Zn-dependent oxidoreductase